MQGVPDEAELLEDVTRDVFLYALAQLGLILNLLQEEVELFWVKFLVRGDGGGVI